MSSAQPPLGLLLKQVQQALRAEVERVLPDPGLTLPQMAVLMALRGRPGQSSAELARASFIRPQSMAEVLDGLVAAGLVTRRPHPAGGRALLLEPTAAGVQSLEAARAALGTVEARMLGDLSRSEQEQLRGFLERCLASLRTASAAGGASARRSQG